VRPVEEPPPELPEPELPGSEEPPELPEVSELRESPVEDGARVGPDEPELVGRLRV
jgi:hypothetical protein